MRSCGSQNENERRKIISLGKRWSGRMRKVSQPFGYLAYWIYDSVSWLGLQKYHRFFELQCYIFAEVLFRHAQCQKPRSVSTPIARESDLFQVTCFLQSIQRDIKTRWRPSSCVRILWFSERAWAYHSSIGGVLNFLNYWLLRISHMVLACPDWGNAFASDFHQSSWTGNRRRVIQFTL